MYLFIQETRHFTYQYMSSFPKDDITVLQELHIKVIIITFIAHTPTYTLTHTHRHSQTHDHIHVHKQSQLVPKRWCNGPIISFDIPKTCYSLCPGQCDHCSNVSKFEWREFNTLLVTETTPDKKCCVSPHIRTCKIRQTRQRWCIYV